MMAKRLCWVRSLAWPNASGRFASTSFVLPLLNAPVLGSASSGFCVFQAEAVAPALDIADRGRREVHRAAQRVGVAVALEEIPPCGDRLLTVGVDAHDQIGIA